MSYNWKLFKDVGEGLFKSHPMEVVRAAAGTSALVKRFSDFNDRPGAERWVAYNEFEVDEKLLCLRMVQATVRFTLLTDTFDSAADCQDSNDPDGRLLHSDGLMKQASAVDVVTLQGLMFDEYYERHQNRLVDKAPVTEIEIGDWFWVIVDGPVKLMAGEGTVTAAGDLLVTDADAGGGGGRVRTATAITDTSATDQTTSILEHTAMKTFAHALEAGAEDALFDCYLHLREYGYRTTLVTHWD